MLAFFRRKCDAASSHYLHRVIRDMSIMGAIKIVCVLFPLSIEFPFFLFIHLIVSGSKHFVDQTFDVRIAPHCADAQGELESMIF